MSGRTVRCAKLAATMARIGSRLPDRPIRVRTAEHATTAAERAARIAADDAARARIHPVPHSQLGAIGTMARFREAKMPALEAFPADKPMAAWAASSRTARNGKKPRSGGPS